MGWFLFDVIASFPYSWVFKESFEINFADDDTGNSDTSGIKMQWASNAHQLLKMIRIFRFFRILKLIRVFKLRYLVDKVCSSLIMPNNCIIV